MAYFFLSYRMEGEDKAIAVAFQQRLKAGQHDVFMAGASIRIGDNWRERIEKAIEECDYFLVLLSAQSSVSEMVITEVRRVRARSARTGAPVILPIRIGVSLTQGLLYDLDGYLNAIQQREWNGPEDTERIAAEILALAADSAAGFQGGPKASDGPRPNDDERPLPVADPEPQGAQVGLASRFYQRRPKLDREVFALVEKDARQLIKLQGPEQIGKSSLISRAVAHATQAGIPTAIVSFQLAAVDGHLDSKEQGIRWFFRLLSRLLGLEKGFFEAHWSDEFGPTTDAILYMKDALLPRFDRGVVVCIDNLDCAFFHEPFSKAFLPLLRVLYERGANEPRLDKLRQVVAYSSECWVKLPIEQSPFQGVGETLRIPSFTSAEVASLCKLHGLDLGADAQKRILQWLGGQPYLTRLTLHHVAKAALEGEAAAAALDRILSDSATDASIFADHLRRKYMSLSPNTSAQLAEGMRRAVAEQKPVAVSYEVAVRLVGLGLVQRDRNDVSLNSQVYREYFKGKL